MSDNNNLIAFVNGGSWVPTRSTLMGQLMLDLEQKIQQTQRKVAKVDKSTGAPKVVHASAPKQLISVAATESPSTQVDRTFSQVSVSFTRDPSDSLYAGVDVWFLGYKGNSQPVLVSSGADSPIIFLCETTKEVVTVVAQPFSIGGIRAPFGGAVRVALALDGVVSAPAAPSIAQQTVTITAGASTAGQQLQFNFLPASLSDVVLGYWVYRVGSHTAPTPPASRFKFVANNPNQQGVYTFQDLSGVSTNFYWVSAVNKAGLESALSDATPAGGGGGGGTVTTYRPSADTVIQNAFTNPSNVWDGNSTTFSSATSSHSSPLAYEDTWQGWPSASGSPTAIKLKITSQASVSGSGDTVTIKLRYSLDGGSTYTNVYQTSVSRALTTDVITLPNAQNLTQVKIDYLVQVTAILNGTNSASGKLYEAWIEVTT